MKINKLLTKYNYSKGNISRVKYIVIHYVGATGGAEANCKYYASKYLGASAHYYIGFEGEIWQSVEDKNVAWHCGAKSYRHPECRNSNSIGIELCVRNRGSQSADSRDWYFEDTTVEAAAELTRELMKRYGVPADHVVRHYDVTGKICPNPFVYNHTGHTWEEFKQKLNETESAPNSQIESLIPVGSSSTGMEVTASSLIIRDAPAGQDTGRRYNKGEIVSVDQKCFVGGEPWMHTPEGWVSGRYLTGWLLQDGRWWYVDPGYTYPAGCCREISGALYTFDPNGWMLEGKNFNPDGSIVLTN